VEKYIVNSSKLLSPEAFFLAQNAPQAVWWPPAGLHLYPLGELTALPTPLGESPRRGEGKGRGGMV